MLLSGPIGSGKNAALVFQMVMVVPFPFIYQVNENISEFLHINQI